MINNGFTGSWQVRLQPEAGVESHVGFATFCADGTLLASSPPVEQFPPAPSGIVHVSAGHGMWESPGGDQANFLFQAQASNNDDGTLAGLGSVSARVKLASTDDDGTLAGLGSVSARVKLASTDKQFEGSYAFQMADRDGNVFATEKGAITGARIELDA